MFRYLFPSIDFMGVLKHWCYIPDSLVSQPRNWNFNIRCSENLEYFILKKTVVFVDRSNILQENSVYSTVYLKGKFHWACYSCNTYRLQYGRFPD